MSIKLPEQRKPLDIKLLELCLNGTLQASSAHLNELRRENMAYIRLKNSRNQLLNPMEDLKAAASKSCLLSQDLSWKYSELVKDACAIFGPGYENLLKVRGRVERNFQNIIERKRGDQIIWDVKQMRHQLKKLHKMGLPKSDIIPIKSANEYVITLLTSTYCTEYYDEKTMSKILTIASEDDVKLFGIIKSRIAEKLRMDIVKENRKYIMWYKLKKLDRKIDAVDKFISECRSKYFALNSKLKRLPVPKDSPDTQYVSSVASKCKKLEYGLKILDDYSKIDEFAKWASEYGELNPSDPDIADAVKWVNTQANEQLNLLHNELIVVRNYCNIQKMSLFE